MTRPADVFARLQAPPARRPAPGSGPGTAVVLGGSVAGLLAARVLADVAGEVVLVEPDEPGPGRRRGVPHADQVHTLLPGGRDRLDHWFPDLIAEAAAAGAQVCPPARQAGYSGGVRSITPEDDAELVAVSRDLLERLVRERVLALPRVRVLRASATGVDVRDGAVRGVRLHPGDHLAADLTVDAMGRSSRMPDWLADAGCGTPALERVPSRVDYVTAVFARDDPSPAVGVAIDRYPPGHGPGGLAVAALGAVDGGRWMVLLCTQGGGDRIGQTADDVRAACERLPTVFADAARGELLSVSGFHLAENRRRRYDLLDRMPARLLSVGDAVASFNPSYGQGMSSAGLHASALEHFLADGPDLDRPVTGFLERQRVVVDAAWQISAESDRALWEPPADRLRAWLAGRVLRASVTDPVVAHRVHAVVGMQRHPAELARPTTIARALFRRPAAAPSRT